MFFFFAGGFNDWFRSAREAVFGWMETEMRQA